MHDVMLGKRKGSWTPEEDDRLVDYIKLHGPGRWDYLAKCAGLERSGKSCRLRWLNYLRPGLRSDGITLEEQLRIIKLQLEWGNRWSKIAESLPGRTDNEVKNYWRTRVHKRAKDLNYDADSPQFKHILLNDWMPRLAEQIQTTFGNDDDAAESSTIMNNIHSATSIKQEGTTHFGDTATSSSSSTLENKGRTRLGNHAGSHMIERDDMSGLAPQSQPRLGYGSPCSIMQMETNKLDRGPFGPNHFTPDSSLPPLSLPSSPLSSNDRPSQGSGSSHYLTSDYYDDKFQLDQNDGGLKKAENWSFSRPEFSYDGGILGHEVDDTLTNLELLMSNENMTRDLQQLLFDNDDDSYLVTSFCSNDPPALYQ